MSKWLVWIAAIAAIALFGCHAELPSLTPLGSGPTAGEPALPPTKSSAETASPQMDEPEAEATGVAEAETESSSGDPDREEAKRNEAQDKDTKEASGKSDGGKKQASAGVSFVGNYSGSDTAVYRIEGLPEQRQDDPKAKLTIEQKDDALEIVIINTANGEPLCTLRALASGNKAQVDPGQSCFSQNDEDGAMDVTVERGSLTIEGDRLILDLKLTLMRTTDDDQRSGSIEYHFEGRR